MNDKPRRPDMQIYRPPKRDTPEEEETNNKSQSEDFVKPQNQGFVIYNTKHKKRGGRGGHNTRMDDFDSSYEFNKSDYSPKVANRGGYSSRRLDKPGTSDNYHELDQTHRPTSSRGANNNRRTGRPNTSNDYNESGNAPKFTSGRGGNSNRRTDRQDTYNDFSDSTTNPVKASSRGGYNYRRTDKPHAADDYHESEHKYPKEKQSRETTNSRLTDRKNTRLDAPSSQQLLTDKPDLTDRKDSSTKDVTNDGDVLTKHNETSKSGRRKPKKRNNKPAQDDVDRNTPSLDLDMQNKYPSKSKDSKPYTSYKQYSDSSGKYQEDEYGYDDDFDDDYSNSNLRQEYQQYQQHRGRGRNQHPQTRPPYYKQQRGYDYNKFQRRNSDDSSHRSDNYDQDYRRREQSNPLEDKRQNPRQDGSYQKEINNRESKPYVNTKSKSGSALQEEGHESSNRENQSHSSGKGYQYNDNKSTRKINTVNNKEKEYSDSRLFNPYEDVTKARERRNQQMLNQQATQPQGSTSNQAPTRGLLHIPASVNLTASPISPDSHTTPQSSYRGSGRTYNMPHYSQPHSNYQSSRGFKKDVGDVQEKPVVVVRPSFNQDRNPYSMIPMAQVKQMYLPFYGVDPYASDKDATLPASCPVTPSNAVLAKALNSIRQLEQQMSALLAGGVSKIGSFTQFSAQVKQLRDGLLIEYQKVILTDLDFCNKANVEQEMWKTAFYNVIELYRRWQDQPADTQLPIRSESEVVALTEEIRCCTLQLLSEGSDFLETCLTRMEETYRVGLEAVVSVGHPAPDTGSRSRKLVYLSAQKLMLFLGDLTRYSQLVSNSDNFGKARSWYLKALMLAPKNGRPYNQLAVLAVYTHRRLDAMYYYMRTLAASNPFLTATQSLTSLFDEVRRKADEVYQKQQECLRQRRQRQQSARMYASKESQMSARVEVWIHPSDGSKQRNLVEGDVSDAEDYANMSFIELNKRFTLSFLHAHGMLFTKIGMENFPEVCSSMLLEFESLLNQSPCIPFSETRLCELLIVNMFNSGRAADMHQSGKCLGGMTAVRSLHQEQACRMAMDQFALLCRRCAQFIKESGRKFPIHPEVRRLLPSIRLWTDWMVIHPEHWTPPPGQRDPMFGPHLDDWALIANLCTEAAACLSLVPDDQAPRYYTKRHSPEACSTVLLEEGLLAGFTPMLDQTVQMIYFDSVDDKANVEDYIRLEKLQLFGDYLAGIEPQVLDYIVAEQRYVSCVYREQSERADDQHHAPTSPVKGEISPHDGGGHMAWADIVDEDVDDSARAHTLSTASSGSMPDQDIAQLRQRRTALQRNLSAERRLAEQLELALEVGSGGQRCVQLEVSPVYLVADTNCYIDSLQSIKALMAAKRYTLLVPLLVVNELMFLSKTTQVQVENSQIVQERALATVAFLEEEFERRSNPLIKAVTVKGTLLETIAFRNEEIDREGKNNDDVILSCCLKFCQDKARDFMPKGKDEPIRLRREVVLLTSDRNLRLKAVNANVPVRSLPAFLRWAKIPFTSSGQ